VIAFEKLSRILSNAFGRPISVSLLAEEPNATGFCGFIVAETHSGEKFNLKVPLARPHGARNEVLVNQLAFVIGIPNSYPARLVEPIPDLGGEFGTQPIAIIERRPEDFHGILVEETSIRQHAETFLREVSVWATYLAATGSVDRHELNILWSPTRLAVTEIDFENSFVGVGDLGAQLAVPWRWSGRLGPATEGHPVDPRLLALNTGLRLAHYLLLQARVTIIQSLNESGLGQEIIDRVVAWIDSSLDSKSRLLGPIIQSFHQF
jgi:hypothetical protein